MSEKVTKYRVMVFSKDKQLLFCKSLYSSKDAQNYYNEHLKEKYPKDKFIIIFNSFVTCE